MREKPTQLSFKIEKQKEVQGIEMGVLNDGTPYLTSRGLAALCGVVPSVIIELTQEWSPDSRQPRDQTILRLLLEQEYSGDSLAIPIHQKNIKANAHPEAVCMVMLEYYAFEAKPTKQQALSNYRVLAKHSLREFIYQSVGYDPNRLIPEPWQQYHDRLLLNTLPVGYFSVFTETADLVLAAIRNGLTVDSHTVPDISVGKCWSQYWEENFLGSRYGERTKTPHIYPEYYPQSAVKPEAWIYPLEALGEFRIWVQNEYLPQKFPKYIGRKVQEGLLLPSRAKLMLAAINPQTDGD